MMKNTNKGKKMKTITKMVLSVGGVVALSTVVYATCASNVDMGNHRIVNVTDPIASTDVVNKRHLEAYMYETMKNRYIRDNSKEVVLDVSTNLMWQDDVAAQTVQKKWVTTANYNAGNYFDTSGDTATTYCTNLSLGGYTDWRLPSKEELFGIVKSTVSNPSISNIFQHTVSSFYWSSTTYASASNFAWIVYFSNGTQDGLTKGTHYYVRCVRAGQ